MQFPKIISFIILLIFQISTLPETCEEAMKFSSKESIKSYICGDKVIGKGNFGTAFLVYTRKLLFFSDEPRVLKIQENNDRLDLNLLRLSKKHALEFAHPNVIRLFEFEINSRYILEIMEFGDKGSLKELVATHKEYFSTKSVLLSTFRQLLDGVRYLHQEKFVHGDLKPANIVFDTNGVLKIIDLDFLVPINTRSLKKGTPIYLDPEVLTAEGILGYFDEFVDVYALGKILAYISQGGKIPFKHNDFEKMKEMILDWNSYELAKGTDVEVAYMINRCLQNDKKDRLMVDELIEYVDFLIENQSGQKSIRSFTFYNNSIMNLPTRKFRFKKRKDVLKAIGYPKLLNNYAFGPAGNFERQIYPAEMNAFPIIDSFARREVYAYI